MADDESVALGGISIGCGDGEGEGGTLANSAGDGDVSAYEFDEAFGDGEAESCALVASGAGAIYLAELFEDGGELILGNANACVGDGDLEMGFDDARGEAYFAFVGEL